MTRQEQILDIASQYAINETDGQNGGKAASKRGLLLSAFRDGATWADSHPRWIPVEERRPDERQVVWVRKHFKRKYVGEFDLYDSAAFCNGEFQCDASGNVTHWMEIVPPRKEADND